VRFLLFIQIRGWHQVVHSGWAYKGKRERYPDLAALVEHGLEDDLFHYAYSGEKEGYLGGRGRTRT